MAYSALLASQRIYPHRLTEAEAKKAVSTLLQLAQREAADSEATNISRDGRYEHAYAAVRALAEAAMTAEGYRAAGGPGQHQVVFEFLSLIPTANWQAEATYFDVCRRKRNRAAYGAPGLITQAEVEELIAEGARFRGAVIAWLRQEHLQLAP